MIASSAARSFGLGQQPARLVEEPRVLERDAQARRQGREQPHVRLAEGVLAIEVLDARSPRARDRRPRAERRRRTSALRRRWHRCDPFRVDELCPVLVHDDRLASARSTVRAIPDNGRSTSSPEAHAALDRVRDSGWSPASVVVDARCRRPGRRRSRWILSPTRSYIDCMSSFAARPCWTLLMIASSAARSSVSVSRRFVSSNRRAFSSATLRLEASVVSSRTSDSRERVLAVEVLERDDARGPRRR